MNASTRTLTYQTLSPLCLSPTPHFITSSLPPYHSVCHPFMLELMLELMLKGMLELMLELMLGGMLEGMLEGGQSPVLPPTTSHFLFVLGLLLLLLLPYPTVTTSTSTVSVLAFTPLPFGRPTFNKPAARFSFNSLIRC